MRVALLSPYSWTYPGGVARHVEALGRELRVRGHHVDVLAPFDPPDRRAALTHGGAEPLRCEPEPWLVPLGRTIGIGANGGRSNISITPETVSRLRTALVTGRYDVVHVHEPVAPVVGWDALTWDCGAALVGTFHCYGTRPLPHAAATLIGARRKLNRLHVRIAVSEAAAWTGRRFYGGRYRVIPNGVELPDAVQPARPAGGPLRIAFVGQAVARKGLPVLVRAFEALRAHVDAELHLVGVTPEDVAPLLDDVRGVQALGRVDEARKAAVLAAADVLCAPSLGGESFGMVLTEAFAHGLPVVASDIPGYRDVVRDGVDGMLVQPGEPAALAAALRALALDPARRRELGAAAAQRAGQYAWPRIADAVERAYVDAIAARAAAARATARRPVRAVALRVGALPADAGPRAPARRLPPLEPPPSPRNRFVTVARRTVVAAAAAGTLTLGAVALDRIGADALLGSLLGSSPGLVLAALAVMCASMVLRAGAWRAILRAALPDRPAGFGDAVQGTAIGVLMSATLPARLGEPSRALIVARRLGRPRETLPAVVGTLVSQTLLNVLALVVLGAITFSTVDLFTGRERGLLAFALAPAVLLLAVLAGPALLRGTAAARARALLQRLRGGLHVFAHPRLGAQAVVLQLGAWAVQLASCWLLLGALDLGASPGIAAAAAVLFAVNVTAVVPLTPSNLGVFQAACVAVLTGGFGVSAADALSYGILLQAVEVATALLMGVPALLREGTTWREVRLRALHAAPVELPPLPRPPAPAPAR